MLPIRAWRIYYADGSTFSSADGTWEDAPTRGVQVVVWYHDDGLRTITAGEDVYTYGAGGVGAVKHGSWIDEAGYYRILDRARRSVSP